MPQSDWPNKTVRELMEPRSKANTVSSDTETTSLLSAMVQPGNQTRFMVVDHDQLVGMVSLKDLLELVALKLEIESRRK
jgi:CBS domain containing-hemolysin-like protein